ncbi:hypothetical protein J6590_101938 [Homalodisca vitripennis]|nr:hypothetical protein J6590_101938 [Homalodisca vitripennis]
MSRSCSLEHRFSFTDNTFRPGHTYPHRARHACRPCVGRYGKRIAAQFPICKFIHVRTDTRSWWPHCATTSVAPSRARTDTRPTHVCPDLLLL